MNSLRIRIKVLLYMPLAWIWLLMYRFSSQRKKIDMDLDRFCGVHMGHAPEKHRWFYLVRELVVFPEFRTVFLFRLGKIRHIVKHFMPRPENNMTFTVPRDKFGGGVFVQHGFSTGISAHSIGEHCWFNQRVTVGFRGDGYPTIGNNVSIGVGAVVIGDIKIGNNVKIGANALVLHDVPDNSIVIAPEATVIRKNLSENNEQQKQ